MNSSVPVLRCACPGDAPSLTSLAFRSKASNGYDAAFMEACRDELTYTAQTMALGETWIAELDGMLAGFFDLRPLGGSAEVLALFVDPRHKRRGVGRVLWLQLERCAIRMGAPAITLDADPAALPFYEAMGCLCIGKSRSGSIPGRFLPRLRKALR